MRLEFDRRRQRMVELLRAIPGLQLAEPKGAFYCFPNLSAYLSDKLPTDVALAEHLLEAGRVAVVPGSGFLAPGFLRLSYATSMKNIEEGVGRIAATLAALR
jgi:aspartate aminotransferase